MGSEVFSSGEAQALASVLGITEAEVQTWGASLSQSDVLKLKLLAAYVIAHPG